MHHFSRRLCALALALLMAVLAVSCGTVPSAPGETSAQEAGTSDSTAPSSETEAAGDGNVLAISGIHRILRSDTGSAALATRCGQFRTMLSDRIGAALGITTDYTPVQEGIPEILVGASKRQKTKDALAGLGKGEFLIRVDGDDLLILGDTDENSLLALNYFIDTYLSETKEGEFTLPRDLNIHMSIREMNLQARTVGSPYKHMYSDYNPEAGSVQLFDFDSTDFSNTSFGADYEVSVDSTYMREGRGALRFVLKEDKNLCTALWQKGTGNRTYPFEFSVADRRTTTLKLWLYVDDVTLIACDHDSDSKVYSDQATFFFRVLDTKGRAYCWNHTLTGNGWHEIELSFNIHNGVPDDFDFSRIVNFGVLAGGKAGAMFELDDLRVVTYTPNRTPVEPAFEGRLISDCEYDAFDGLIVQEWYGCEFDTEDKVFGKSSAKCSGTSVNSDFRTIIANLDLPMDYDSDSLTFYFKMDRYTALNGLFIELNEVQDRHEYEATFSLAALKSYGLSEKEDTWSQITIPLSAFRKNLNPDMGDTVRLHNARFVISGREGVTYTVHYDRIGLK